MEVAGNTSGVGRKCFRIGRGRCAPAARFGGKCDARQAAQQRHAPVLRKGAGGRQSVGEWSGLSFFFFGLALLEWDRLFVVQNSHPAVTDAFWRAK